MLKIKAEKVKGKNLKLGDLFSTAGQSYWSNLPLGSIGEKVYIRTETPTPEDQLEVDIYRITIERG